MSELCLSSTSKSQLFSLLISDFVLFSSFIISHPLYFSYFIFFSPYLLKLLSFLSPLFITTSLLLLAFLSVSPTLIEPNFSKESSHSKVSLLVTTYHAVIERLRSKIDNHNEEFLRLEDIEVFKIVFDTSMISDAKGSQVQILEDNASQAFEINSPVLACSGHQDFSLSPNEAFASNLEVENSGHCPLPEKQDKWAIMEEKSLECFLQQLDEFESAITTRVEGKKIEPPGAKANKGVEKQEEKSLVRNGSEAAANKISQNIVEVGGNGRQKTARGKDHSQRLPAATDDYPNDGEDYGLKVESSRTEDCNLRSHRSMRKEKDWKRTLACKLFEERHNADGDEGMDSLWETYEMESAKTKAKGCTKKKNKKKHEIKFHGEEEYDDNDDQEDESNGQLCCLQALKFSAGKMNLGMGRPSLVRISKAIKGIGWLHQMSSRHSKKVHNGDRF